MIADPATVVRFAANHVWQSTLSACAVGAMALFLRKGEARSRHALWMAASLKFLLPFAVLTSLGERLSPANVFVEPAPVLTTVLTIGQPFSGPLAPAEMKFPHSAPAAHFPWVVLIASLWAIGAAGVLIAWIVRWTRVRTIVRHATPQLAGREADALRAAQTAAGIHRPIPLLLSHDCMEPGICGVFRPVLLWPAGISTHLDDGQLAAIVAHEVAHVERRDNLLAVLHMCVEAVFWFYPVVWWMGARLLEERERACDEAVLRLGNEPGRYADAILKACRFCVESPLPCVSGVSGSNLKRRMVQIMNTAAIPLSRSRKMLLASVAVAAIAGPVVIGALHPSAVRADEAQSSQYASLRFDTATLTPTQPSTHAFFVMQNDGEFLHNNITMKSLIAMAYGVNPERIVGGPDWLGTEHFNFEAHWKPTHESPSKVPGPGASRTESNISISRTAGGTEIRSDIEQIRVPASVQAMLRNFLAERVNLRVRNDSAVMPVYELVVANGGSKLTPSQEEQPSSGESKLRMKARVEADAGGGNMFFSITGGDAHMLCDYLTSQLGHQVFDNTGLTGRYNFQISFPVHADSDQIAAALREQFGLDLQSTQKPVHVVDVDSVDMPQAN